MKPIFYCLMGLSLMACMNENTPDGEAVASGAEKDTSTTYATGQHPAWSQQSSIYEVNIRQHTPQGTFNAFREKLPELSKLGVEILWFMPVQPIGVENRKGKLGSYYSIQDYTAINPEFGTMEDFKNLVTAAHDLGFKVILDWVANHTAWDHKWIKEHPNWYTRKNGKVVAPVEDWSDVADLNYDSDSLRSAMQEAMMYWVNEADIDGFRCDVAMMVPMDFWNETRLKLDSLKPVFMLAEAEGPEFHDTAFDMTYGWEFHHIMNEIAKGGKTVAAIDSYYAKQDSLYDPSDMHMYFTTNHDENSWNGTVFERMGQNAKSFFILSATFPNGMPLVYTGQEYGNDKRLVFFDKDTVSASDSSLFDWYASVIDLKMTHPALSNAGNEGDFTRYKTPAQQGLYAYSRMKEDNRLLVILNFSDKAQKFDLGPVKTGGSWKDAFTNNPVEMTKSNELNLQPNGYKVITISQ